MASKRDKQTLARLLDRGVLRDLIDETPSAADDVAFILAQVDEGRALREQLSRADIVREYGDRGELLDLVCHLAKAEAAEGDRTNEGVVEAVAEALEVEIPETTLELSTYDERANRRTLCDMMDVSWSGQTWEEVVYHLLDFIK